MFGWVMIHVAISNLIFPTHMSTWFLLYKKFVSHFFCSINDLIQKIHTINVDKFLKKINRLCHTTFLRFHQYFFRFKFTYIGLLKNGTSWMGSLFTNGGKIKDVIGHDSYSGISHRSQNCFLHSIILNIFIKFMGKLDI